MSDATERRIANTLDRLEGIGFALIVALAILGVLFVATFNMAAHRIAAAIEAQKPAAEKAQPAK